MHDPLPAQGDIVWIRQARWRVEGVRRMQAVVRLDVSSHGRRHTFLSPFDRWSAIASDARPRFVRMQRAYAVLAGQIAGHGGARMPLAAVRANIAILPHQLEPALAIAGGARRILIADDVGLGKTIQAGLIVAELISRDPAARVLIIAPAVLGDQWRAELAGRFQIDSTTANAETLNRLSQRGSRFDTPWRRSGVWIVSPDYLKQPHVMAGLPLQPWDLIAIDEAHAVSGPSDRHRACHELARQSRRVVLMTATPHNGDEPAFSRLLDLGGLEGIDDALVVFRRTRADAGLARARRIRWRRVRPSPGERRVFDALLAFERAVLRAAGSGRQEAALLLLSVLRKRALSTMSALVSSLNRRLAWLEAPARAAAGPDWLQPGLAFDDPSDEIGDDEQAALRSDIGLATGHERSWLRRLLLLANAVAWRDSKVAHLARLLRRSRERVVIFTEFRHSLEVVRQAVHGTRTVTVLHGGLSAGERRRALDQFLAGGATALVATDVASQGLNLQDGARWVINLELPWNPARLEQRVGRVDRIGQRRPVHATLLVMDHETESGVLERLARRAMSARRALGGDLFAIAMPAEARVRASVLTGSACAPDADDDRPPRGHSPLICRRWERPARFVARQLARRRRLASAWQGRPAQGSRAVWTRGRRGFGVPQVGGGSLLVFAAAILDHSGGVIEQRVIAVRAPCRSAVIGEDRRWVDAARITAARRVSGRLSRLSRLLRERRHREEERERTIDAALAAARHAAQRQPGLFDRRHVYVPDQRPEPMDDVRIDGGAHPKEADAIVSLHIGPVVLTAVLCGRP